MNSNIFLQQTASDKMPANSFDIKKINRSRIFDLIYNSPGLSRKDIQNQLDLSLPTIGQNITELLNDGLIKATGSVGNTGGRKAEIFSVNAGHRVAVGLDITSQRITVVLIDLNGNIITSLKVNKEYERSLEYLQSVSDLVHELLYDSNIDDDRVLGVGFGIPALTDITNKQIVYSRIMDLGELSVEYLEKIIGFPVMLVNDANASCLAELYLANEIESNGFYIMLGTNVGGAMYINSQLFTGDSFRSGEVGHMIIHENGKQCYCGQKGCLDPYCAATVLTSISDGDFYKFFNKLDSGDSQADEVWEEYLNDLALAIRNVRILFNCTVVIGGYVGSRIEKYMPRLKRILDGMNTFDKCSAYVRPCDYKQEAIATGAGLQFLTDYIISI